MVQSIILTENLCKSFGDREVVKMVNLDVKEGEVYGLVGPAGAGKTTTLLLLTGYYRPGAGTIQFCGRSTRKDVRNYKRHFGFLPERTGFYEMATARENLMFFGSLYDIGKEELRIRVDALLEYVGLAVYAGQRVKYFTPGMNQRLGLAKALLYQPEILILDEPFAQMDLPGAQLVRQTIQRQAKDGKTIIISSHYFTPLQELCTTIGVMIEGELVYQGTPERLVAGVKDSYKKYRVHVYPEGLYSEESVLNTLALVERGIQILEHDYDVLVVAGPFVESDLKQILEEVGISTQEICTLAVSDEEYFYQYCSQYQELMELTGGGERNDEDGEEIILDGIPLQDTE